MTISLSIVVRDGRPAVVVTATGDRPVRLWELHNSWGWNSLTVELRAGGDSIVMERRERDWTKNGPTFFTLDPGQHVELSLDLDDGWWQADGALDAIAGRPVDVRVTWRTPPSPEATALDVWVGEATSPWTTTTLPRF